MRSIRQFFALGSLLACATWVVGADAESYARKVSSLIDPAKLATLRERGANPRVQKYVAQLADAQQAHIAPEMVASRAVEIVGMKGDAAKLTVAAMVRNLAIAEKLGCLDANGLRDMRKGQAPTVQRGPYKGDQLSVDHIIPRAVVPELDNVIANLELLPLRANESKNAKIGQRQIDLARKLNRAGLLDNEGLQTVGKRQG
jgi:hypothetical protein